MKKCNIFIPRNIYSIYLILSKKKYVDQDDYILINNHQSYARKFPKEIISFLKNKNFKIIFIDKSLTLKSYEYVQNNTFKRFLTKLSLGSLNHTFREISKINYEEFNTIEFSKYKNVNIYYGSDLLYYSKLCKNLKNINLYFLEHGAGNFLNMINDCKIYEKNIKLLIMNVIRYFFFRIKGVHIPYFIYYFGILGCVLDIRKLEYDYFRIKFLRANLERGVEQLYNFYEKKLIILKKKEKSNYIFLNIPYHYDLKTFKKYLDYVCKRVKLKKNSIVLTNIHTGYQEHEYINILLKTLKLYKINSKLLSRKSPNFPAEIVMKYFNVKEIYSGYSTILFSSFYLFRKNLQINVIFSNSIAKKYKHLSELNQFSTEFIKNNFLNKNIDFIDLDLIN